MSDRPTSTTNRENSEPSELRLTSLYPPLGALLAFMLSGCTCCSPEGKYELDASRLRASVHELVLRHEWVEGSEGERPADPDWFRAYAREYAQAFADGQRGSYIHLKTNGQAEFLSYDCDSWHTGEPQPRSPQLTTFRWMAGRCNTPILIRQVEGKEVKKSSLRWCGETLVLGAYDEDTGFFIDWQFVRCPRR